MDGHQAPLGDGDPSFVGLGPDGSVLDLEQPRDAENSANNGDIEATDAHSSSSIKEVAQPGSRARYWLNMVTLVLLLAYAGTLLANVAVQLLANSIQVVAGPIVIDNHSRILASHVMVATNMTEALPQSSIPISTADFITTLASPCQVVPTPVPVAKSIRIVVGPSTPMPTPEPTPSAMPEVNPEPESEPEPETKALVPPGEAFRAFQLVFEMNMALAMSLLKWWFELQTEIQYAAVAVSLVVVWALLSCFASMSIGSFGLAMTYFTSAFLFQLPRGHGLTSDQSLITCMAAGLALTASIKTGLFFLLRLRIQSWNNATGLSKLTDDLENLIRQLGSVEKMGKQLQNTMLDSAGLREVQKTVEDIRAEFKELRITGADAQALASLKERLNVLSGSISDMQTHLKEFEDTKASGEELNTISGNISDMQTQLKAFDDIKASREELDAISGSISEMQQQLETLDDRQALREELDAISGSISDMQQQLGTLDDRKASKEDLNRLLSEVSSITQDASGLQSILTGRVDQNDERLEATNSDVTGLKGKVEQAERDAESMQKQIQGLEGAKATKNDLKKLQEVGDSNAGAVKKLRSDTDKQHKEATGATKKLGTRVEAVETKLRNQGIELEHKIKEQVNGVADKLINQAASTEARFNETEDDVRMARDDTKGDITKLRTQQSAMVSKLSGRIQSTDDRLTRMEEVNMQSKAQEAELLGGRLKEQVTGLLKGPQILQMLINLLLPAIQEALVEQIQTAARDTLTGTEFARFLHGDEFSRYIQAHIATIFKEQQAHNPPPRETPHAPHESSPGGQETSPDDGQPSPGDSHDGDPSGTTQCGSSITEGGLEAPGTPTPSDTPYGLSSKGSQVPPDTPTPDTVKVDPNTPSDPPIASSGLSSGQRSPDPEVTAPEGPSGGTGSRPLPPGQGEIAQPGASDPTNDDVEDDDGGNDDSGDDDQHAPGTPSVGDNTDGNGATKKKKSRSSTSHHSRKSKAQKAARVAILCGKKVNEDGKLVDSAGAIFGRVIEGDASKMIGLECNDKRQILSNNRTIVGYATLDPAILEGMKVTRTGHVVDSRFCKWGTVVGTAGRMRELEGRTCNDKGQVVTESGEIFQVVLVEDDEHYKAIKSAGGPEPGPAQGSSSGKPPGPGGSQPGPSLGNSGSKPSGLGGSKWAESPGSSDGKASGLGGSRWS